jgi:hypothetical protein
MGIIYFMHTFVSVLMIVHHWANSNKSKNRNRALNFGIHCELLLLNYILVRYIRRTKRSTIYLTLHLRLCKTVTIWITSFDIATCWITSFEFRYNFNYFFYYNLIYAYLPLPRRYIYFRTNFIRHSSIHGMLSQNSRAANAV